MSECDLRTHARKLETLCRMCGNVGTLRKITKICIQTRMKKFKNHKKYTDDILKCIFGNKCLPTRYPESLCRSCESKTITFLLKILPQVIPHKKGKEAMSIEEALGTQPILSLAVFPKHHTEGEEEENLPPAMPPESIDMDDEENETTEEEAGEDDVIIAEQRETGAGDEDAEHYQAEQDDDIQDTEREGNNNQETEAEHADDEDEEDIGIESSSFKTPTKGNHSTELPESPDMTTPSETEAGNAVDEDDQYIDIEVEVEVEDNNQEPETEHAGDEDEQDIDIEAIPFKTPTKRKHLTEVPETSPDMTTPSAKRKFALKHGRFRGTQKFARTRRHTVIVTPEGGVPSLKQIEVGRTAIMWENIVSFHLPFAKEFDCAFCNFFIVNAQEIIQLSCNHKYCNDCYPLLKKESKDCWKMCGVDNSLTINLTNTEEKLHEKILCKCTKCDIITASKDINWHNTICHNPQTYSCLTPYLQQKTEISRIISLLKQKIKPEDMDETLPLIHSELTKGIHQQDIEDCPELKPEEAGALRQFADLSARTYIKVRKFIFRLAKDKKKKVAILPEYKLMLQSDKEQMPSTVSYEIIDGSETEKIDAKDTEDPIDFLEDYKSIHKLREDIQPNIEVCSFFNASLSY